MTSVMEFTDVSEPSSTESDAAIQTLQGLFTQQQERATKEQRRRDVISGFVLMSRGSKNCRLQTFGQQRGEWRPKGTADQQLTWAAAAFSRFADSSQAVAVKLVLWSLAAECYHLIGRHGQAAEMAALALSHQQHPDTGTIVQARLDVCRQVQAGKTLTATSPCSLLHFLQNLVLAA